ncbi:hypothetical protein BJX76DRAFT_366059 [Aspergillus varians]
MFSKLALAAAAILSFSVVDAHMLMVNPVPYSKDSLDNSPILSDGSNFPCKNTDYTVSEENHLAKGQAHQLEFEGSATHGGGSCQISITSDRAPTRDTKWSVIKSIEGGCMDPNEGADNIGNSAAMKSSFSPSFTIPDSFEDGKYTLAWTWFNRIGNREMYMNCAPITVSGSSSKRSDVSVVKKRAEDYPPLFIANINGCQLLETKSVRFPNPGGEVESFDESNVLPEGTNVCNEGSPTWGDAGYSSGGGSAPEPTSAGADTGAAATTEAPTSTEAPTTSEAPPASVSIGGAVGVPNFTAEPEPTTTEPAAVVPTTSTTLVSSAVPTATSSPDTTPNTSTEGALSGSCTDEGAWNCIGGTSFQRCASGTWTGVENLAGGTECTPGQNQQFAVKAAVAKSRMLKEKRSRRRSHEHDHA